MDSTIQNSLSGTEIPPGRGVRAQSLAVMFHGYDSNGAAIAEMRVAFASHLPDCYIFAPDGPRASGDSKYRWFEVANRSSDDIFDAVAEVAATVNDQVDTYLMDLGLNDSRAVFIGFSQGASIAIHAALTRARPLAGVLSYSGQIVKPTRLKEMMNSRPPVCIIHGRDDPVTPVEAASQEIGFLMGANVPVTSHICDGVKHSINKEGLVHGTRFLVRALKP